MRSISTSLLSVVLAFALAVSPLTIRSASAEPVTIAIIIKALFFGAKATAAKGVAAKTASVTVAASVNAKTVAAAFGATLLAVGLVSSGVDEIDQSFVNGLVQKAKAGANFVFTKACKKVDGGFYGVADDFVSCGRVNEELVDFPHPIDIRTLRD